ncbi:MAG: ATP-binding protein [Planctomycetota bacterium]|nr:ATP-binding protein [Planctomycetota bacterium]
MTVSAAPSIFDAFNARNLTPQEVARRFVPSDHFDTLAHASHTLVVGPRGSGKTTLLKMLHPLALESWRHPTADKFRSAVDFTGVFIPTDLNWSMQLESLGERKLDSDAAQVLEQAAFTTHILHSLTEAMLCRIGRFGSESMVQHRRVQMSIDDEVSVVRTVADAWQLKGMLPSFEGVRNALSARLSEISVLASQEALRATKREPSQLSDLAFLHLDYLSSAAVAVEVFNDKVHEPYSKWALLFDELELAPRWIRNKLIRSLRSVDERFLFKLSLSPYCEELSLQLTSGQGASLRQDYEEVRLWYVHKEDSYAFCRDLVRRMLQDRGLPETTAAELFGPSVFSTDRSEWSSFGTAYRRGSAIANRFVRLAEKDPTFRDYLDRKHISCENLEAVAGDKRAADIRKVTSIVAIREYFRPDSKKESSSSKQRRRSVSVPTVYAGATSLFAMVEGNPRWLIGIVGNLLRDVSRDSLRVDDSKQVREIMGSANTFRAMLKTILCAPVGGSRRGLLSMLDALGDFFARASIDEPFDPEPHCSFIVDSRSEEGTLRALGEALNAGAIVYAPGIDDAGFVDSLRGKRFRLSYLLAPHYHFPLMLGREISLSEILRRKAPNRMQEPTLFGPLDDDE